MTDHHWMEGRQQCGRCHVTAEEQARSAEPIPCSVLPDCPNGCRGGIVGCWSPGGPCPERDRPGCDTCGPCNHCRPDATASWMAPDDVERAHWAMETGVDRVEARIVLAIARRAEAAVDRAVPRCTYCGKDEADGIGVVVGGACPDCTRAWA